MYTLKIHKAKKISMLIKNTHSSSIVTVKIVRPPNEKTLSIYYLRDESS